MDGAENTFPAMDYFHGEVREFTLKSNTLSRTEHETPSVF